MFENIQSYNPIAALNLKSNFAVGAMVFSWNTLKEAHSYLEMQASSALDATKGTLSDAFKTAATFYQEHINEWTAASYESTKVVVPSSVVHTVEKSVEAGLEALAPYAWHAYYDTMYLDPPTGNKAVDIGLTSVFLVELPLSYINGISEAQAIIDSNFHLAVCHRLINQKLHNNLHSWLNPSTIFTREWMSADEFLARIEHIPSVKKALDKYLDGYTPQWEGTFRKGFVDITTDVLAHHKTFKEAFGHLHAFTEEENGGKDDLTVNDIDMAFGKSLVTEAIEHTTFMGGWMNYFIGEHPH